MYMLNGIGTTLYGKTEIPGETAYIATQWFCIFWLPIIPIRSYVVYGESGTNLIIWSSTEYQLTSLGYIYRPHLKAYIVTALVFLFFWGLSFSGSDSDRVRISSSYVPVAALSANDEGLEYASNNQYEEAVTSFSRAINLYESSAVIWHNRGMAYFELGDNQAAINDFTKSILLDPDQVETYCDRGAAYFSIQLYDSATIDYEEAILRNDHYADAYYGLGIASYHLEKFNEAIAALKKSLSLGFPEEIALTTRAYVYYELGQAAGALADAEKVISIDGNMFDAILLRAMVLDERGDVTDAIDGYNDYLNRAPISEIESFEFVTGRLLELER